MRKEIDDYKKRKYWEIVLTSHMPKAIKPIMEIWPFKRKIFLDEILNKQKDRLCAHGGQQQWGINYGRHMHQW